MTHSTTRLPALRRARLYLAGTALAAVVATGAITVELATSSSASATSSDDTTSSDSTSSSFDSVQPPAAGSGTAQHSQTARS